MYFGAPTAALPPDCVVALLDGCTRFFGAIDTSVSVPSSTASRFPSAGSNDTEGALMHVSRLMRERQHTAYLRVAAPSSDQTPTRQLLARHRPPALERGGSALHSSHEVPV